MGAAIWIPLNYQQDIQMKNDDRNQLVPDIIIENLSQILNYLPLLPQSNDGENYFSNTRRRRSLHQSSAATTTHTTTNLTTSSSSSTFLNRKHPIYKRVSSLPEFDGCSDNSLDSSYNYS